jgi:hypothetical protein
LISQAVTFNLYQSLIEFPWIIYKKLKGTAPSYNNLFFKNKTCALKALFKPAEKRMAEKMQLSFSKRDGSRHKKRPP